MNFYEAAPGHFLPEGVTMAEHQAAMADNYVPQEAWEEAFNREIQAPLDAARTWKTRDGRLIRYTELDEQHLVNCARMVYRYGFVLVYPSLFNEVERRGLIDRLELDHS